MQNTVNKENCS